MSCHSIHDFKVGQKVRVNCLIHSVTPNSNGIATPSDEIEKSYDWEIVAIGVKGLPSNGWGDPNGNDTILKRYRSTQTLYISHCYIYPAIYQPKNGDVVEMTDGSYSMKFEDDKLSHSYGCELKGRKWRVLQAGLKNLPTETVGGGGPNGGNDTLLQEIGGKNTILFIHSSLLKPCKLI